ncbi:MAG TPA: hypothetical protein VJL35_02230 [Gemmatimonadaceae bacterium]|nr:hypothetical protein [Gemmatimonadaceae bacterium]
MGQFLPADHSRGDANTVGGYTAVHSRPPAFEGKDGASYSVEVMTDETGDTAQPWAGYLFFVRYQHGDPIASGHVETPYLRFAPTEAEARALVDSMQLNEALAELNNAIAAESDESRPWYDAMRDEDAG